MYSTKLQQIFGNDRLLIILLMFFYYASLGILFPYLPLNLSTTLSTNEVGILMATGPLIMLICQPIWGWLSDRWSIRVVLLFALGGTTVASIGLLFAESFMQWLVVISLYFLMQNPLSTLLDTMALSKYSHQFGRIRLWGSIGFACAVFAGGFLVGPLIIYIHAFCLAVCIVWICNLKIAKYSDDPPHEVQTKRIGIKGLSFVVKNPIFIVMLCFLFFTSVAMKGNYTFYSIGLTNLGAPGWLMGSAWLLQVVPEVWVFLWADRLSKSITPIKLAVIGSAVYTVQFSLLGWIPNLWVWTLFQPLISLSYCFWYVGGIQSVKRIVPEQYQATGQSIYAATCFGLGGVLGSSFSGWMVGEWDLFVFYKTAGLLCAVAAAGLWFITQFAKTNQKQMEGRSL